MTLQKYFFLLLSGKEGKKLLKYIGNLFGPRFVYTYYMLIHNIEPHAGSNWKVFGIVKYKKKNAGKILI